MRQVVILMIVFVQSIVSAQTLRVEKFGPKVSDVSARTKPRVDNAGNECALVKVQLTQKGAIFLNAVGEVENLTNEYYVYLSRGTQKLRTKIRETILDVLFADYGIDSVEAKTTYEMKIVSTLRKKSFDSTNIPSDFIASAEKGDAEAECNLGKCYFLGQGTTQNYYLALTWFRKAAEKDWAEAQYYIGRCYYYGQGFPMPDYKQAVIWLEKAAKQNYADAQYQLGLCYEKGQGVKQDSKIARKWYEKAAANGNSKAIKMLRTT